MTNTTKTKLANIARLFAACSAGGGWSFLMSHFVVDSIVYGFKPLGQTLILVGLLAIVSGVILGLCGWFLSQEAMDECNYNW